MYLFAANPWSCLLKCRGKGQSPLSEPDEVKTEPTAADGLMTEGCRGPVGPASISRPHHSRSCALCGRITSRCIHSGFTSCQL